MTLDASGTYVACGRDDGVVRAFTRATGPARHARPPGRCARAHLPPRDGRLVSDSDSGKLRFWCLVGAVEFEVRSDKDSGHACSVLAVGPLIPESRSMSP
ncbi:MAG TPA: hypothetical protein VK458_16815 [Myxococcaceae bacterium]|nr:hypothetical protein [Myxococcaceae bacterium]